MFTCIDFLEGRKSVNTLGDMLINEATECIFYRFQANKVSTHEDMSTQEMSTQRKIDCTIKKLESKVKSIIQIVLEKKYHTNFTEKH